MPPVGIRTHNLSRRAAADLRLRPRGHWDRLPNNTTTIMKIVFSVLKTAGSEIPRDIDTILLHNKCDHSYGTLF
jgi:hypothetical protein